MTISFQGIRGRAAVPKEPDPATKAALGWTHSARFLTTASQLDQLPASEIPEIAFVGRSNAGKSTAINRLAQQKRLAFASRTPGRTQHINLFEVGPKDAPDALFADLPGYGYAAVERSAKLRWQAVMADYLQLRRPLHGVVLMVDSRLGFTELDQRLLTLMAPRLVNGEVRLLVLLTKADKLNRGEAQLALQKAQDHLSSISTESSDIAVSLFSALSREGLGDVAVSIRGWVHPVKVRSAAGSEAEAATHDAEIGAESKAEPDSQPATEAEADTDAESDSTPA